MIKPYCISTATIVTRSRHNVMLCLYCRSSCTYREPTYFYVHFRPIIRGTKHSWVVNDWVHSKECGRLAWNSKILNILMLRQVIHVVTTVFKALMEASYALFQVCHCLHAVPNIYSDVDVVSNVISRCFNRRKNFAAHVVRKSDITSASVRLFLSSPHLAHWDWN